MTNESDEHASELIDMLTSANLNVRVTPSRLTPSTIYDPTYRSYVIAKILETCGSKKQSTVTFNTTKLRLYQFLVIHPRLISELKCWLVAQEKSRSISLHSWEQFPTGYIADTVFDSIVSYLTVLGSLRTQRTQMIWFYKKDNEHLSSLVREVNRRGLFEQENAAIRELKRLRIPLKALGKE